MDDLASVTAFLAPEASFADLDAHLIAAGWVREPDRAGANTGRPEPVFVSWSLIESDGEIDYTWEPEIGLRRLEIRGLDSETYLAELAERLPVLAVEDVRALLRSPDRNQALRGLGIALALKDGRLAEEVIALKRHPDEAVRQAVARAVRQVMAELAPLASPTDPAQLFAFIPDVRYRRQTLRWLLRTHPEAGPAQLQALAAALADPDWEVRATAVAAAVRWRAKDLLPRVRTVDLAPEKGARPTRYDAGLFKAMSKIATHLLQGDPPLQAGQDASERDRVWAHLCRCLLGLPVERPDHVFLLIQALTEPLPVDVPRPDLEPAGLAWVPPVDHWLGDDIRGLIVPNPVRRVCPERGFFLAENLYSPDEGEPWTGSWDEARRLCDRIGEQTGLAVRLPTADEWEMAARGPDGRIFPWGNGLEPAGPGALSPWGCRGLLGTVPQWTQTPHGEGRFLVCGASRSGCAARAAVDPATPAGLRFAVIV